MSGAPSNPLTCTPSDGAGDRGPGIEAEINMWVTIARARQNTAPREFFRRFLPTGPDGGSATLVVFLSYFLAQRSFVHFVVTITTSSGRSSQVCFARLNRVFSKGVFPVYNV